MNIADYKKLVRLCVPEPGFIQGESCSLSEGQGHYLRNVMRKTAGDRLRVFNGRDGDWLATLTEISKNKALIKFDQPLLEQKHSSDIWILASPVKKEAFDMMIEKSCELGAARFIPVNCDHTVVHKINQERLQAIAVEAAEQSERSDVMDVAPLVDLKKCLSSFDPAREIIFCIERVEADPFAEVARKLAKKPLAILIGPEGGFSTGEIDFIKEFGHVHPVSLGSRVLRAETALIAALSGVQFLA